MSISFNYLINFLKNQLIKILVSDWFFQRPIKAAAANQIFENWNLQIFFQIHNFADFALFQVFK